MTESKISINNAGYYHTNHIYSSLLNLKDSKRMHGPRRVAVFCVLTAVLPTLLIIIPLYLRHSVFADVFYQVSESDILEIQEGTSSIFCQGHTLTMNTTFNAYQLASLPEISNNRKHIRLKKSMILPDDTLEYWGFYLLKGSTVALKVCSRFEGSKILVVRGEKNLRTCGLLNHNINKPHFDKEHVQVKVTFETAAQEIVDSREININIKNVKTIENELDLNAAIENFDDNPKQKRETGHKLDGAIEHGGNALNYTEKDSGESNSVSSFENNLLECYDGQILLTESFPPSELCTDVHFLARGEHLQMTHEVSTDGYYYYIFYSDNDILSNDIHAVFDIYKPTFQYVNASDSKKCINSSKCHFSVSFFSDETVIVEVPTRDGIEHEEDDITLLVSKCEPRMAVYIIFPIAILFLILGCAFL